MLPLKALRRNDVAAADGLASELDYAEQTSWLLFLKYLDDLEAGQENAAALEGREYTPILEPEFRWDVWAAPKRHDGEIDHQIAMTGQDLVDFVNGELFPYPLRHAIDRNRIALYWPRSSNLRQRDDVRTIKGTTRTILEK